MECSAAFLLSRYVRLTPNLTSVKRNEPHPTKGFRDWKLSQLRRNASEILAGGWTFLRKDQVTRVAREEEVGEYAYRVRDCIVEEQETSTIHVCRDEH